MRIGLDLDNTLISYDDVFLLAARAKKLIPNGWEGNKTEIKEFLRSGQNGEEVWKTLQGQVYSRWIEQAVLVPGVSWFLYRCRAREVLVYIVSHKTKYGHNDPERMPLRDVALSWMREKGFFDADVFGLRPENIYFESTRESKVRRIEGLACTHFVDDLPEVFAEPEFPCDIKKILYAPWHGYPDLPSDVTRYSNWYEIAEVILGPEKDGDLLNVAKMITDDPTLESCRLAGSGGNSQVYRADNSKGNVVALKRYPISHTDKRDRLGTELVGSRFLHRHGIDIVPRAIKTSRSTNITVFEWIYGEPVKTPREEDLSQAILFIEKVNKAKHLEGASSIKLASEACISGKELFNQIDNRRCQLRTMSDQLPDLQILLDQVIDPLWDRLRTEIQARWPPDVEFDKQLEPEYQTLSPSDFGFHNALREKSGRLRFLDLEYFGWDDPVKLTSDFLWHPGISLREEQKTVWVNAMTVIFANDYNFVSRLNLLYPCYGLRWALIVLNVFLEMGHLERQNLKYQHVQLHKSCELCDRVIDWVDSKQKFS